ncbi:hypothetical protein ABLO16_05830, partial [Mycobacterium tuberculosis]
TSFGYRKIWVFNLNQEGKARHHGNHRETLSRFSLRRFKEARCFRIYRETLSRFSCAAHSQRIRSS